MTQAEYLAETGSNPSYFTGDLNRPVETVSWNDAVAYCRRLTASERTAGRIPSGWGYRLPTEAEWEYAARAGTTGATYGPLDEIAWYGKNADDETHPVGGKKPNAWGLYDMLGNVREWTSDTFQVNFYATSPVDDPTGPQANYGERGQPGYAGGAGVALPVIRGGAWPHQGDLLRVSDRYHYFGPTLRLNNLGFRLIRQPVTP